MSTKSVEKNDPLMLDAVLVCGCGGAIRYNEDRKFQLDFSQYVQVIRSSYNVMTRHDRGLGNFISFSIYQYYCIILLWKRLKYVLTYRGRQVNTYETLKQTLPPMVIPDEIGYYLDGIGNLIDYNSRQCYFELQDVLRVTLISGISGTYGSIDSESHISYETLPSAFIAVYRILQDLALTVSRHRADPIDFSDTWDLPLDLKPEGTFSPNRNLLCWDKSTELTVEQRQMCLGAGLDVTFMGEGPAQLASYDTSGVSNFDGLPIIYSMLMQTSVLLLSLKSQYYNYTESTSFNGSLAQVGFMVRGDIPTRDSGYALVPLNQREATAHFPNQAGRHMCSAASLFRYRVDRHLQGHNDSLCYTGPLGEAPTGWGVNANAVFESIPIWNESEFRTTMTSGRNITDVYCDRIRKMTPNYVTNNSW